MKILSVKFKNINSLKGEHQIDFTIPPIKDAGIFAITGATGSGKTTILDAISLALYDTTPRVKSISNKVIEKTGAILTRNTKDAYSEVKYQCKQGIFTSKWSISTARTGKLKKTEMEIADATGTIITTLKSDVAKKNEELIGLTYDQFIRSILLAQGEFAKFLTEKKDKRNELLKQITGAWIYEEIGKKAFEMYKKYGEQLKELTNRKSILLEGKMDTKDFDNLSNSLAKSNIALEKAEQSIQEIMQSIQVKKDVALLETELKQTNKSLLESLELQNDFKKSQGKKLIQHQALSPILEELRSWKQLTDALVMQQKKETQFKKEASEIQDKTKALVRAAELLTNQKIVDFNSTMDRFEKEVLDLEKKLEQHRNQYRNTHAEAKILLVELNLPTGVSETHKIKELNLKQIEINKQKAQKLRKILHKDDLKNPENALETNRKIREIIVACQGLNQSILKEEERLQNSQKELQPIMAFLKEVPQKIELAKANEAKYKAEVDGLLKDEKINLLKRELTEHRHLLKDGLPCPLCGATKHPYSADYQAGINHSSQVLLQKKQEQLGKESAYIIQLKTDKKNKEQIQQSIQETIKETTKEIQHSKQLIQEKLQKIGVKIDASYGDIIATNNTYEVHLKEWAELRKMGLKQKLLIPLIGKLLVLEEKGKKLDASIKRKYAGSDIRKDISLKRNLWNEYQQNTKHNQSTTAKLKEEILETSENIKKIQVKVAARTHRPIEDLILDILPQGTYQELSDLEKKYQNKVQQNTTKLKTLESQLKQKTKDTNTTSLEIWLKKEYDEKQKRQETKQNRDQLHVQFTKQTDIQSNLKTLEKEIKVQEDQNQKWILLNEYIGDANGKRFNSFAQDLTLHQLVYLANIRLKTLNKRYQLAVPTENEDDSLSLIDLDMGSERRSVNTLSGGEQFIVSLSLALALSDLASRHIEINTLFIDEGFGTLDEELLDQIIDTLEKLQSESQKTIGIISHVPALKERITTQIQVVKNGQGHSRIEIV